MPGAYSTDLRERVLVAVEAGEPADAVAEAFMVGRLSWFEGRETLVSTALFGLSAAKFPILKRGVPPLLL